MTKREVLTNIIGAYIAAGNMPAVTSDNKLKSPFWVNLVEAICNAYPERDSVKHKPDIF